MPHVGSVFEPDVAVNQDDAAGEPPSARTMFFVAFDDSVCGANSSSSAVDQGRLQHTSKTGEFLLTFVSVLILLCRI